MNRRSAPSLRGLSTTAALILVDRASGPSRRTPCGAIARVSIVTRRGRAADPDAADTDATTRAATASVARAAVRRRAPGGSWLGYERRDKRAGPYHGRWPSPTGRRSFEDHAARR